MKLTAKERNTVNRLLSDLPLFSTAIPIDGMQNVLDTIGVMFVKDFILCGREGRATFDLFRNGQELPHMLVLTWYKFDTGRYEIVAYVS
jgi:hypothetical protein